MTTQNSVGKSPPITPEEPGITFLGTADAFNAGGSANSCYWVNDSIGHYTIDFGPTALMKCHEYGCDLSTLDLILITHLHGDHIGGLPMLLLHLTYDIERTRPLYIVGPRATEPFIEQLWQGTYPSTIKKGLPFDIRYIHWDAEAAITVCNRSIKSIKAVHDPEAQAHSLRIEGPDYSLAISGDTGWQSELIALSKDADVFICESTNLYAGYWGHLSIEEHCRHRESLKPKQLILSHLSTAARARAVELSQAHQWTVAYDGMRLSLSRANHASRKVAL